MKNEVYKWIYTKDSAANCFFRSSLKPPYLKVMIQVTERCNMKCKHCFLSSTNLGNDLSLCDFEAYFVPKLKNANVRKVTLTGGEPLLNPDIMSMIKSLNDANIQTGICSNASLVTESLLKETKKYNVHFNVSLDGMNCDSYGTFRELDKKEDFKFLLDKIKLIGTYGMLNGILVTPNKLSKIEEYISICDFAIKANAKYLLLNPLSPFGRGKYAHNLCLTQEELSEIRSKINAFISNGNHNSSFEVVYVRFPNTQNKPQATCSAGSIPYIFTNGDIAICPYIVFASNNPDNRYSRSDFIIGNIFDGINITDELHNYMETHCFCRPESNENIGCTAMKITNNLPLDAIDEL